MAKLAYLNWSKFLNGDGSQGDMGQSFVSDPVLVGSQDFSVQLTNTAAASPAGAWAFETSNDGVNYNAVALDLLTPTPTNPDGTAVAQSQTVHFSGLRCQLVRVRYTRAGGGAADTVKGNVVNR
jgi:hypothetical protein